MSKKQVKELRQRFEENRQPLLCIGGIGVGECMAMAKAILSLPSSLQGVIVECGAGGSTINLSIVAKTVNRRLLCFDSFKGLPDDGGYRQMFPHLRKYGYLRPGILPKSLESVSSRVEKYGCPDVCKYTKGWFEETLKELSGPVVLAFLDVDLPESTRTCLRYIWPLLQEGGYVFSHDAVNMDCVRIFFHDAWWQENLGCASPGFVGSGCGLPTKDTSHSSIGYTQKVNDPRQAGWSVYPGLELGKREQTLISRGKKGKQ